MRIILNFATSDRVSTHLLHIASEIDKGRIFGLGWCLRDGGKCPVPGENRAGLPCGGDTSLCQNSRPVDRDFVCL